MAVGAGALTLPAFLLLAEGTFTLSVARGTFSLGHTHKIGPARSTVKLNMRKFHRDSTTGSVPGVGFLYW